MNQRKEVKMSNEQPKQEIQLSPKQKTLKEASEKLEILLQDQAAAMPKNFNQTRFLQNCITVLRDTKDIEKCTPMSIARTMIKGAYLDLDFFRKECYAIPYGSELNFQTDYKGEIKACKAFSPRPILDIYAKLVREGDKFEMTVRDGKQFVNFEPLPFNEAKTLGAFAVVVFEDGGIMCDQMSVKEIEDVRQKYSKVPNGPAWLKSLGEMQKKVVLRRLTKMISLKFETLESQEAYEEGADSTMDPNRRIIDIEIEDPFKKAEDSKTAVKDPLPEPIPEPQPQVEKAVFNEEQYRKDLLAKHPNYDPSYIDMLVKEAKAKW